MSPEEIKNFLFILDKQLGSPDNWYSIDMTDKILKSAYTRYKRIVLFLDEAIKNDQNW